VKPESLPEDILSAYVDGECTDEERAAVDRRLASDAAWRAILEEVRDARAVVRALPPREPPAGFVERLLEAPDEVVTPARRPRRVRIFAGVTAVAAVVAGFALASPSRDGDDVTPPVATLADSHGATSSLQQDPISGLAPIAATHGLRP
jgi:anti-sigma factor RsiW